MIRRILRRAIRYGWDKLGFKKPFLYELVDVLADQFSEVFPEIQAQSDYLKNVIKAEENSFLKTLGQGIELFEQMVEGKKEISGEDAFKLHDTYGFPIDLTELMAREQGLKVDTKGFESLMQEQKERARSAGKFSVDQSSTEKWTVLKEADEYRFSGYDTMSTETEILAYRQEGERYALILKNTPFYAESGGQVADTGELLQGEQVIRITDVQKGTEANIHYTNEIPEDLSGVWSARVHESRRREIMKHHSATHLLHAALRKILGDHVAQKGSLVDDHHLRFDFSHFEAVTPQQLDEIEELVNLKIQENIPLQEDRSVPIEKAKERGAMMLFGEKYGEEVRVITFDPDYSMELCGGTHVAATGQIGYFRFLGESSVASGVRRVEAVCGMNADQKLRDEKHLLRSIRQTVGQTEDLRAEIEALINDKKELEKAIEKIRMKNTGQAVNDLIASAEDLAGGIKLVKGEVPGADMNMLKQLGYDALDRTGKQTVIVLASKEEEEGKVYIMVAVSDDLIESSGLKAGALVGQLGRMVGGGGGGQPNLATAGGRQPEKLEETLKAVNAVIMESIS